MRQSTCSKVYKKDEEKYNCQMEEHISGNTPGAKKQNILFHKRFPKNNRTKTNTNHTKSKPPQDPPRTRLPPQQTRPGTAGTQKPNRSCCSPPQ